MEGGGGRIMVLGRFTFYHKTVLYVEETMTQSYRCLELAQDCSSYNIMTRVPIIYSSISVT